MNFKFISVVIPAHNEQEYLTQCLESLVSQDYSKDSYEVIVVDNNSTDNTHEIAVSFGVTVIKQITGPVGAVRNTGAKHANGEFLAFIDADCVAPSNWLSKGIDLFNGHPAVYGGGCDLRPNPFWVERAWLLENKVPPNELLGCNIFIKKSVFLEIGFFDEKITSGEDTKLSNSLRSQGYQVTMTEDLNVVHLGNPITLRSSLVRQIWHSENYLQNWKETIIDLTFYLLIVFLTGLMLGFFSFICLNWFWFLISIIIIISTPLVFTTKRLCRSKFPRRNLRNLPAIFLLDCIYLVGRTFGLGKSVWKFIR